MRDTRPNIEDVISRCLEVGYVPTPSGNHDPRRFGHSWNSFGLIRPIDSVRHPRSLLDLPVGVDNCINNPRREQTIRARKRRPIDSERNILAEEINSAAIRCRYQRGKALGN